MPLAISSGVHTDFLSASDLGTITNAQTGTHWPAVVICCAASDLHATATGTTGIVL